MSKKKVLSKFIILCWATFIAILGCMRPVGCRLDMPASPTPDLLNQKLWDGFQQTVLTALQVILMLDKILETLLEVAPATESVLPGSSAQKFCSTALPYTPLHFLTLPPQQDPSEKNPNKNPCGLPFSLSAAIVTHPIHII